MGTQLKVVDADTHLSEPWDLWTSRAPAAYVDRVPQVVERHERLAWVCDGTSLGPAIANSVIDEHNVKHAGTTYMFQTTVGECSPAASQLEPRLELMDSLGIWAQIVYPNAVGFGSQQLAKLEDPVLRSLCVTIYNDAMAELQEESGGRLFPQGAIPWWDLDEALAEIQRIKDLGLVGVNTTSDPHVLGVPDLSDASWSPMWELLQELELPLNFHIGASATQMSFAGTAPWPSFDADQGLAIGSAMLYLGNARVLANFIFGGILERFPRLQLVSVESGVGWIPFFLQALDWQMVETAPRLAETFSLKPSEYFRRQCAACFWFEDALLVPAIEHIGVDNCLFETDFPHPTCLYPEPLDFADRALSGVDDTFRRKVLGANAARIYKLPGF